MNAPETLQALCARLRAEWAEYEKRFGLHAVTLDADTATRLLGAVEAGARLRVAARQLKDALVDAEAWPEVIEIAPTEVGEFENELNKAEAIAGPQEPEERT